MKYLADYLKVDFIRNTTPQLFSTGVALFVLLFCSLFTRPLSAATLDWNGTTKDEFWDTVQMNWLNGAVPTAWSNVAPDNAVFSGAQAGNTVSLGENIIAGTITVQTTSPLTLAAAGGNAYTLSFDSFIFAPGASMNFDASLELNASAVDAINGGDLNFYQSSTLIPSVTNAVNGGTITLFQNAVIRAGATNALTSHTTVKFDKSLGGTGGTLHLKGHSIAVGSINSVNIWSGLIENASPTASMLTVGGASNSNFSGAISDGIGGGSLSLTKDGTGTLTLSSPNDYSGGTVVKDGTLLVTNSNSTGTGDVIVEEKGTLGGGGFIAGNAVVNGTLAPGIGAGVWNFGSRLTLTSTSMTVLNVIGTSSYESISIANDFVVDGKLKIILDPGYTPAKGDTFDFFNWGGSISSKFASYDLPTLGGGLEWDTANVGIDGTITVVPEPSSWALMLLGFTGVGGIFVLRRRRA